MSQSNKIYAKGRGSQINPPNRFDTIQYEEDFEYLEHDEDARERLRKNPTVYFPDLSKTIVSENKSPDISFRYSINPYRGCLHGCAYCYARPYHEYLGLNAGLDFETKIYVKEKAPELFKTFLSKKNWKPQTIAFSGVTDCYQPAEKTYQLTRGCLEIAHQFNQPIGIITKNALILRDLDLLSKMAATNTIRVNISITTLDKDLARSLEPRTSTPNARLRTVQELKNAGVPVNVMIAPIIPGLTDIEIPALLKAVAEAGADSAHYTILRLPRTVHPVFMEWLERVRPSEKEKIISRIQACRNGKDSDSQYGSICLNERNRRDGVPNRKDISTLRKKISPRQTLATTRSNKLQNHFHNPTKTIRLIHGFQTFEFVHPNIKPNPHPPSSYRRK